MRDYVRGLLGPVGRKNSWQLAEFAGHSTPDGLQHLLAKSRWEPDEIRDDVQAYVAEYLGTTDGVLIIDDTGFVKKGITSAGVQRQYSGTAGGLSVNNCQSRPARRSSVGRWNVTVPSQVPVHAAELQCKFEQVLPHLDERRRRLYLASEAVSLGHGGIALVAAVSRTSTATIARGITELETHAAPRHRIRAPGGGRKPLTATDTGRLTLTATGPTLDRPGAHSWAAVCHHR
jgi:hypothetical protein